MSTYSGEEESALKHLRIKQGRILKLVFAINALMFFIEFGGGIFAKSTALLADSLDMFGDTVVYAFSLFVLYKSDRWRSGAALLKGILMLAFGAGILILAIHRTSSIYIPVASVIGAIGFLVFFTNLICLGLLWRHQHDDMNMKSVWLCSRNDVFSNVCVLVAAGGVSLTNSKWPDIIVGIVIAVVFLRSAIAVIVEAVRGTEKGQRIGSG